MDQLEAMVGEELGELSEANRHLASLVRFSHFKLKQAVWGNEELDSKCYGWIDEVEDKWRHIES